MAYFAVSYQLNNEKDYETLWAELDRLNGHRVMYSFYFVDTVHRTAKSLRTHLKAFVDEDDMLAIVKLETRPACSKCFTGTGAWLNDRF